MKTQRKWVYGTEHGIDFDARYAVVGQPGVAFYLNGWVQKWEPYQYVVVPDLGHADCEWDDEEYLVDSNEGEWIDDPDHRQVRAVMVGDDREHIVDVSDLTVITDYCSCCGQIDCHGDFRDWE